MVPSLALGVGGKAPQGGQAVQAAGRQPGCRRVKAVVVQLLGVLEIAL